MSDAVQMYASASPQAAVGASEFSSHEHRLRVASGSAQGPREHLEDTIRTAHFTAHGPQTTEDALLVVCDGVGGASGGDIASALAATQFVTSLGATFPERLPACSGAPAFEKIQEDLCHAFGRAHDAVLRRSAAENQLAGMATTAVIALVIDSTLHVAWLGDSRCYLFARSDLRLLTHDHREIQAMLDLGIISEQDAHTHPLGHTITRYIGHPERPMPELRSVPLAPGDLILLCSDGLTDSLSRAELTEILRSCRHGAVSFPHLPGRLIERALRAGADDNVSVVCAECVPSSSDRTCTGSYRARLAHMLDWQFQE